MPNQRQSLYRMLVFTCIWTAFAIPAFSQNKAADTTQRKAMSDSAGDTTESWGSYDPGEGFDVAKTPKGSLNISGYAMFRYINQLPAHQSYRDHLGNLLEVDTRNDLQFHRALIYFTGFVYMPKLRYVLTVWTVNATNQVAVVGSISYLFNKGFNLYAGINGMPGTRSMSGSHPYWMAPDRVMADEFFRPGFTSGIWATGEPVRGLRYNVMLGTNLSQLGISAREDTRDMSLGGTIWWMPTTGEFGPRGAYGDYEDHQKLATRFGLSGTHSREDRFSQISVRSPDNTQIRLSDAVNLFETGALAPGVTVEKANFDLLAMDLGMKYRGFFLQTEFYGRWLSRFQTDGPVPIHSIQDYGLMVQTAKMVKPRKIELYAATSYIFGEFNDSWELIGGGNVYPANTRNFRINLQLMHVNRTAPSSSFGYYTGGQTGTTISLATSVLF